MEARRWRDNADWEGPFGWVDRALELSHHHLVGQKNNVYYFFTCFKDTGSSCRLRGTAHWEGDTFVNDHEEIENGKRVKWRDSFIQITPTSHGLIAARDEGDGKMKTLITTKSTRR